MKSPNIDNLKSPATPGLIDKSASFIEYSREEELPPLPDIPNDELDDIDRMIMGYMKGKDLPIKFKRISEGSYVFGTRKVSAKIMNNRLVIRVGGGYMNIEEFINTYTQPELKRLERLKKRKTKENVVKKSASKSNRNSVCGTVKTTER